MPRRLITAQAAGRDLAKVLRTASRGMPVVVTSNGQPIAAVISMEQLRTLERTRPATFGETIRRIRTSVDPAALEGPDPWADVRDRAPGRD